MLCPERIKAGRAHMDGQSGPSFPAAASRTPLRPLAALPSHLSLQRQRGALVQLGAHHKELLHPRLSGHLHLAGRARQQSREQQVGRVGASNGTLLLMHAALGSSCESAWQRGGPGLAPGHPSTHRGGSQRRVVGGHVAPAQQVVPLVGSHLRTNRAGFKVVNSRNSSDCRGEQPVPHSAVSQEGSSRRLTARHSQPRSGPPPGG